MKKLTIEFIRDEFAKEDIILLSKEYKGARFKLKCKCIKNHIFYISWSKFKEGQRCKYCNNTRIHVNDIINCFENEGYKVLSDLNIEYKNTYSELYVECPMGHKYYVTFSNWKHGNRCKKCYFESISISKNIIVENILNEGYSVISKINHILNSKSKFEVMCKNGHRYITTWNKWRSGYRCKICSNELRFNKIKLPFEEVKYSIEKEGYTLLTNEYKNAFCKLEVSCPDGHIYQVRWNDWQQGCRCPICKNIQHGIKFSGPNHPNWKGGKSFEPYCEVWKDKEYKFDIRNRDGNKCLNPYCSSKNPDDLTIHHIDYNKKNCCPSNLITICRSCNIKANKDREWHVAWYQAIMSKRYGNNY